MNQNALGDRHNFGEAVHFVAEGSVVRKSRSPYWEKSFLTESVFRKKVDGFFSSRNYVSPLAFIPILRFDVNRDYYDVEYVDGGPIVISDEYLTSVGSFVFLCTWLGLTDLHYKNISLGSCDGVPQMVPWDIEIVAANVILPSQTNLISKSSQLNKTSGLFPLREFILDNQKYKDLLLTGFKNAYLVIRENGGVIWDQLFSTELGLNSPIRVVLNDTAIYEKAINTSARDGFCKDEIEQLKQGFIPYFYTTLSSKKVFKYGDSGPCESQISLDDVDQGLRSLPPSVDDLNKLYHFGLEQFGKWLNHT